MTARETFKALWKNSKLKCLLFFLPFRRFQDGKRKKFFIMLPNWYNRYFSMKSINRWKDG